MRIPALVPPALLLSALVLVAPAPAAAPDAPGPASPREPTAADLRVALVKMPYHGGRNVAELSRNPDYLEGGGLPERLAEQGAELAPTVEIALTPEEEEQYGVWERLALANGHLAGTVARNVEGGWLTVALLGNCNGLLGVLGGLQNPVDGGRRRVGLVFIDAHGDFNTPETTLSGMLGGMPVAVSAGHALERIRRTSGLVEPLPMEHIVWGGVRDLDPLEAERFRAHDARQVTTEEIRARSSRIRQEMERLSRETDLIYVHIDMDVLDPAEVPGHDLRVPDGPTSQELGAALEIMFGYPKVAALGIASTPAEELDPDGVSRRAAYTLIDGALRGVSAR